MLRQWESDLKKGNISDFTIVENSGVIVCEKCKNNGRAIPLLFLSSFFPHYGFIGTIRKKGVFPFFPFKTQIFMFSADCCLKSL